MKKIFSAVVEPTLNEGEYQMMESTVCEHGEEWNGDVRGYIENLDYYGDIDCMIESDSALGNVHQDFGGTEPIPGSIHVVTYDGFPCTVYWASEEEENDGADYEEVFSIDSFGSDYPPINWKEICDYLNKKAAKAPEEDVWDNYWKGKYPDAPRAYGELRHHSLTFFAGEGKHFSGGVNYLIVDHDDRATIYAECPVPEGASDDYGYLTMKSAIIADFKKAGGNPEDLEFWYDGQEQYLAPDASADCEVYVDIDLEV